MNGDFFNRIGIADMEKVHSAVIGWIFSDQCKALTLNQKSELLCGLFDVTPVQYFNDFRVEVEHHNIDVIIITDEKTNPQCWVIENKIKSSQHSNQLDKYVDIVQGKQVTIGRTTHQIEDYKNMSQHFCFLTLVNEQPQCSNAKWEIKTYRGFSDLLKNYSKPINSNTDKTILYEYFQCITNLANALEDFLDNHQNYPNVFTDGAMQKVPKLKTIARARPNRRNYANFIAENGLETIFQKCFLSHIMNKTKYFKTGFSILETHGVALAENKELISAGDEKLGIQFQNGTFKAQVVIPVLKKDSNFVTINQNFWKKWNQVFSNNQLQISSEWRRNESKGQKGPYFSYSKKVKGIWYNKNLIQIAQEWNQMYDECLKVLKELKRYC